MGARSRRGFKAATELMSHSEDVQTQHQRPGLGAWPLELVSCVSFLCASDVSPFTTPSPQKGLHDNIG